MVISSFKNNSILSLFEVYFLQLMFKMKIKSHMKTEKAIQPLHLRPSHNHQLDFTEKLTNINQAR